MKIIKAFFIGLLLFISTISFAADVEKTQTQLLSTFTNGCAKCITAQNLRDLTVSTVAVTEMGGLDYFNTTGTTVTIASQSDGSTNLVRINPTTSNYTVMSFDNGGANDGRLRKLGTLTKHCHAAITMSGSPTTNNDSFVVGLAKNGTALTTCKVQQKFGTTTDTQAMTYHCDLDMAANDYIDPLVGNLTAGRNIVIKNLNLFAMCVQ